MNSLDTLARSAATAVHESVADVPVPAAPTAVAAGAAATWRMVRYAAAGAAAGAAAVAVLLVVPINEDTPTDTVPVTTTIETVVTSTLPAPTSTVPTPVVVDPSSEATTTTAPTTTVPTTTTAPTTTVPADTEAPSLQILSPKDGEHFETKTVTFAGRTEPGASVVASGRYDVPVDSDGGWSIDLVLGEGANGVVFVATDAAGNASEARLTVYYDVPVETTTTTKAEKGWEFSAFQKYGSCAEPVPYDEFWGTGKPGSTISVTSEFGGGSTTVNESGEYWLRVEFPSAPFGETFSVKVKDEFGNKKLFEFVSNYEG